MHNVIMINEYLIFSVYNVGIKTFEVVCISTDCSVWGLVLPYLNFTLIYSEGNIVDESYLY